MEINLIVAAARNMAIGKNNQMLWRLPEDFRYFKNITYGMPVLMGRRTFGSLNNKPLPGRVNIVLSRQKDLKVEGAVLVNKIDKALFIARENYYNQVFVIGGGDLYRQMLPKAHRIYITRVDADFPEADTFFPEINEKEFQLVSKQDHQSDEKNPYNYSFEVWERK